MQATFILYLGGSLLWGELETTLLQSPLRSTRAQASSAITKSVDLVSTER